MNKPRFIKSNRRSDDRKPAKPAKPAGVICECGARNFRVLYTRHAPQKTIRVRQCKECNHKVRTAESSVGVTQHFQQ